MNNNDKNTVENTKKNKRFKRMKSPKGIEVPEHTRKAVRTLKKRFSEMNRRGMNTSDPQFSFKSLILYSYYMDLFLFRHGIGSYIKRAILSFVLFSVLVDNRYLCYNDVVQRISPNNYHQVACHIKDLVKLGFLESVSSGSRRIGFSVYPSTYLLRCLESLLKEIDDSTV